MNPSMKQSQTGWDDGGWSGAAVALASEPTGSTVQIPIQLLPDEYGGPEEERR